MSGDFVLLDFFEARSGSFGVPLSGMPGQARRFIQTNQFSHNLNDRNG